MAALRYTGRELTKFLRNLAMDVEDIQPDGEPITKAESLARTLWKKALGWKEMKMEAGRGMVETVHPPESWAIQMIYERLEGKVPQAATDEGTKLTAAERVGELARNRINSLVGSPAAPRKLPPPKLPRKEPANGKS